MEIIDERTNKKQEDWQVGDVIDYGDGSFAIIANVDDGSYSFVPLLSGNTDDTSICDGRVFPDFIADIKAIFPDAHKVKATLHIEEDDNGY